MRAEELIRETIARNGIVPQTVHADRGTSMTSKKVSQLLIDLGVTRSHSRPKVSNDNPYSEAQFKTTKYMADYPERFDSLAHAREWFDAFIAYDNHQHRHSGLGWHTPASVHFGTAEEVRDQRAVNLAEVIDLAHQFLTGLVLRVTPATVQLAELIRDAGNTPGSDRPPHRSSSPRSART